MIELEVNSSHLGFIKGILTLRTIFVSYTVDDEGAVALNIQADEYGLTIESTEDEVKAVALEKITRILAERGPAI